MRAGLSNDSHADLSVRSAFTAVILVEVWMAGGSGSITSVSVKDVMVGSDCSKAVASACPMKPPAPVMRIFVVVE